MGHGTLVRRKRLHGTEILKSYNLLKVGTKILDFIASEQKG
jgi:hypothetical protein